MTFFLGWNDYYASDRASVGTSPIFEKLCAAFVREAPRMLELGAGSGGEIAFFTTVLKFGYHGVDGSTKAVSALHTQYPDLSERIAVADFTKTIPFGDDFDFIADRASIAHNDLASIRSCLALVWKALKPGGVFISSDWFSTWHSEFTRGEKIETGTRNEYPDGQFHGAGNVHFSSEEELVELFSGFEGIFLQERVTRRPAPNLLIERPVDFRWISQEFRKVDYRSVVWDIVVRKPL